MEPPKMPSPLKETPSPSSDTKLPRLKPKTKAFVDLLDKPLKPGELPPPQVKAYLDTHETTNYKSAAATSSKILKSPNVIIYRQRTVSEAKRTVVDVMKTAKANKDETAWQRLALDAANSVLDRQLGKATTRVESTNQNLNINVEASQELSDAFTNFLKDYTAPS